MLAIGVSIRCRSADFAPYCRFISCSQILLHPTNRFKLIPFYIYFYTGYFTRIDRTSGQEVIKPVYDEIRRRGKPWYGIQLRLAEALPDVIDEGERKEITFRNMFRALDEILGQGMWQWERRPKKSGPGTTTWVLLKDQEP